MANLVQNRSFYLEEIINRMDINVVVSSGNNFRKNFLSCNGIHYDIIYLIYSERVGLCVQNDLTRFKKSKQRRKQSEISHESNAIFRTHDLNLCFFSRGPNARHTCFEVFKKSSEKNLCKYLLMTQNRVCTIVQP